MSSKTLDDLRQVMFGILADLRAGKITIDQAKAGADLGQVVINSAKVEVDYIRANGGGESPFINAVNTGPLPPGITSVRQHRLKG